MNVTINLPVDTGPGRVGTNARRANDADAASSNFGALYDQVATAERRPRSDATSGAADTADDGATDVGQRRRDSDPVVQGATQDVTPEEDPGSDTAARAEGTAVRHPRRDKEAAADRVDRRDAGSANHGDDGKVTKTEPASTAASNAAVAVVSGEVGAAGQDTGDGAKAGGAGAKHPHKGSAAGPSEQANAERPDRVRDDAIAARDLNAERSKDTVGSDEATTPDGRVLPPDNTRQEATTAPSAKPAMDGEADPGQVRLWARGDSIAAFAGSADGGRRRQANDAATAPQSDQRTGPTRGANRPIDVRVTAYERHPAAAAPTVAMKVAAPADGSVANKGAPTVAAEIDGAMQAEAGSAEGSRAARKGPAAEGVAGADRDASPATAKEASGRRTAGRQDPVAPPDSATPSEHDLPQGRDSKIAGPAVPVSSKHTEPKQQAVTGASPTAGNPTANPSAPASPLTAGVAQGIAGALATARATAQSAFRSPDGGVASAAAEPIRTIALSLDMREYGGIDVRISLKGNVVSVHLKADRQETADALARDDASLRAVLHRAGYDAQQVQVDKRDTAGPRSGDAGASGQQQAGGAGTGASSGHAAGGERSATPDQPPQPRRDAGAFVLQDQDTHDAPRQDRYRGADRLYV